MSRKTDIRQLVQSTRATNNMEELVGWPLRKHIINIIPNWLNDELKTANEHLDQAKNISDQHSRITLSHEDHKKWNKILELEQIVSQLKAELGERTPPSIEKKKKDLEHEVTHRAKAVKRIKDYIDGGGPYSRYEFEHPGDCICYG